MIVAACELACRARAIFIRPPPWGGPGYRHVDGVGLWTSRRGVTSLKDLITTILDEAVFTIQRSSNAANGTTRPKDEPECVSSPALREIYTDRNKGLSRWTTWGVKPLTLIQKLELELTRLRLPFVDPETGEVELAFPIDDMLVPTHRGVLSGTSLYRFSCALVQAAALEGVDRAMFLLEHLQHGDSLRVRACTVLDDLPLADTISPIEGMCIRRLPYSTSDLPYLPITGDSCPLDCLGRTLLTIETCADLTYPKQMVWPDDAEMSLVCDALAIHSNRYVGPTVVWYEYPEVASFCLTSVDSVSVRRRVPTAIWKITTGDLGTDDASVAPTDDIAPVCIAPHDLQVEMEELRQGSGKLQIAVNRWKRSKRTEAELVDRAIDLRIALEVLYVNDERHNKQKHVSQRGGCHLGDNAARREQITRTLCDAYDAASDAVHKGKVANTKRTYILTAQDYCRDGILKSLHGDKAPGLTAS